MTAENLDRTERHAREKDKAAAHRSVPDASTVRPMARADRDQGPQGARNPRHGVAFLQSLYGVVSEHCAGQMPQVLDLGSLDPPSRRFVEQTLGEGEVSIYRHKPEEARIQESALAGVWLLHVADAAKRTLRHVVEVADVPGLVRTSAFAGARPELPGETELPDGVMNAPALLTELEAHARAWKNGQEGHVINLSLLPHTEQDQALLTSRLGQGQVTILTRGYGNCRMIATALRYVWWVQHFSADDKLILNTLEVTDVPVAALAAQEDIDDSRDRLAGILSELA